MPLADMITAEDWHARAPRSSFDLGKQAEGLAKTIEQPLKRPG